MWTKSGPVILQMNLGKIATEMISTAVSSIDTYA